MRPLQRVAQQRRFLPCLPRDGQPVPGIGFRGFRVHARVRAEISQPEGLAVALEAVAQDVQRALEIQFLGEAVEHRRLGSIPE